jgi:hypothetical protein
MPQADRTTPPPPRVARRDAFLFVLADAPGAAALRERHLADHLEFVAAEHSRFLVAGPVAADAESGPGSVMVVTGADRADAEALLERDPYRRAGVWARSTCIPFRAVAGQAIGGVAWAAGAGA